MKLEYIWPTFPLKRAECAQFYYFFLVWKTAPRSHMVDVCQGLSPPPTPLPAYVKSFSPSIIAGAGW